MTTGPSPQSSLDAFDALSKCASVPRSGDAAFDIFNMFLAMADRPPVSSIPSDRPNLTLVKGGASE